MQSLSAFKPKDLAGSILGMSKIVQNAEQVCGRNRMGMYPHPVHQVLLGESNNLLGESNNEMEIFRPLSEASYNLLNLFEAGHLSNLAYAHILHEFDPLLVDGTLFDKIGGKAIR